MRAIAVLLGILCSLLGYSAWVAGDWRRLIGQLAMVLLAVVIWLGSTPGASEFPAPTAGTPRARMALYWSVIVVALIATIPWPLWFDDSGGSENAYVLVLVLAMVLPLLRAQRRDRAD
jgi:hypothetical protein